MEASPSRRPRCAASMRCCRWRPGPTTLATRACRSGGRAGSRHHHRVDQRSHRAHRASTGEPCTLGSSREHPGRRGPPQPPRRRRTVSAYRDGGRTGRARPGVVHRRRGGRLGRTDAGPAGRGRPAPPDGRRGAHGSGRPAVPPLPRWPRTADQRAWVSTMGRRWASCTPPDGTIRVSDRLRDVPDHVLDYVLLHELAHLLVPGTARPSGDCLPRTRAPSARGASSTGSRTRKAGPPLRRTPRGGASRWGRGRGRRRGRTSPDGARRELERHQLLRVPAGSASTGHQRTSADSALTRGRRPLGATAAYRTSRCSRLGPKAPTSTCRSSCTGGGRRRVRRCPDSSRPRAGAAQREPSPPRGGRRTGTARALPVQREQHVLAGRVEDDAGRREVGRRPARRRAASRARCAAR